MTCSVARELLGAYFDGELDASAELQLRLHVADCEGCAAELQRMQMRRELMRGGGLSYQAPPALEARVRKSLGAHRTPGARSTQRTGHAAPSRRSRDGLARLTTPPPRRAPPRPAPPRRAPPRPG